VSVVVPRKRFGQHFLRAVEVIDRIVDAISPVVDDHFVEIGPGEGVLTHRILAVVPRMAAIEIDRDLAALLRRNPGPERLDLIEADALATDFSRFPLGARLIGNLPYNISTPLIFHLCEQAERFRDMHFMLQKEVVDRMAAKPGTSNYGRLSVMVQFWFEVEALFNVPPSAFYPPPKVDSTVVRLLPRPRSVRGEVDPAALGRVVGAAFAHRRKMLRNAFSEDLDAAALEAAGINPQSRAQDLSLADYLQLARRVKRSG
jgi:16S rRNA (adenine1518-N6/adenine1519-N6)-dimethyltransferase